MVSDIALTYWNGDIDTSTHASIHFQFARKVSWVLLLPAMTKDAKGTKGANLASE